MNYDGYAVADTRYIYSSKVLLGEGNERLQGYLIGVSGHRIDSLRACDPEEWRALVPNNAPVDDLGDLLVTPTFVNGHTHLSMSAFRGIGLDAMAGNVVEDLYFTLESALTAEDVRAFTRMGAYDALLSGVGTVWDHYYFGYAVADALVDVGLTGVVGPTLQDVGGPGVEQLAEQFDATIGIAESNHYRSHGIVAALAPHATDTVSDELWSRIAQTADTHDLPVHTHAAQSIEEYERSLSVHKATPIHRLSRLGLMDAGPGILLVHSLFVTEDDLKTLSGKSAILGYCPFSQVQFCFPAAIGRWAEAGIDMMLGTDCGACNDTMNVQQELRVLANGGAFVVQGSPQFDAFHTSESKRDALKVEEKRVQEREARLPYSHPQTLLNTVWKTPASLHPGYSSGILTVGGPANLAVWDLDHPACWPAEDPLRALTMSDMSSALSGVMTNGIWRGTLGDYARSILSSPEFRDARREAQSRLNALNATLGLP